MKLTKEEINEELRVYNNFHRNQIVLSKQEINDLIKAAKKVDEFDLEKEIITLAKERGE